MKLEEIRQADIEVLGNSPGPVGMVRFLQKYKKGIGGYTKERHEWLEYPDFDIMTTNFVMLNLFQHLVSLPP